MEKVRQEDTRRVFMEEAKPHLDELLESARHHLAYHEARGDMPEGMFSPEELVGETLLRGFAGRDRRPRDVALRDWLLGLEGRTLDELLQDEAQLRELWAVSLDEPLPVVDPRDLDGSFWDWHRLETVECVADVLSPVGVEEHTSPIGRVLGAARELPVEQWRAWLLSDGHRLALETVAGSLKRGIGQATKLVDDARVRIARVLSGERPTGVPPDRSG